MALFECLIKHRPLSVQSGGKTLWRERLHELFRRQWNGAPLITQQIRFSIIYLCDEDCSTDIDNIIKPIQDALVDAVIEEDFQVIDVDAHRRILSEPIDTTRLPRLLKRAVATGYECVYVQISLPKDLDFFL